MQCWNRNQLHLCLKTVQSPGFKEGFISLLATELIFCIFRSVKGGEGRVTLHHSWGGRYNGTIYKPAPCTTTTSLLQLPMGNTAQKSQLRFESEKLRGGGGEQQRGGPIALSMRSGPFTSGCIPALGRARAALCLCLPSGGFSPHSICDSLVSILPMVTPNTMLQLDGIFFPPLISTQEITLNSRRRK